MGLIQMKSNQQMVVEEEKAIQDLISFEEGKSKTKITDNLSAYLRRAWEDAKKEKRDVENQILDNMRAIKGEYDSAKMADINKLGGSTIFMMLTETKARNCEAWVKDILFQPNNIPWDIEPTPMPDLPGDLETTIIEDFMQQTVDAVITMSMQSGTPVDQNLLSQRLKAAIPEIKAGAMQAIKNYAKEKAEEMKDQMNDQLVEGGWYDAFDEIIPDAILKTGILKGPTLRIENQRKVNIDDDGNPTLTVEPTKIPTYERRPPLDIYPGPGATGFDNAYLFDKLAYSPSQIQGFIGLPGFKDKEIRDVLKECEGGSLREWTSIDTERADMEEKPVEMIRDWEEVDVLEFWGPVQGKTIHEWDERLKKKTPDADKFYEINAFLVGNHVIKAILNPDPMGKKPYSKVSFIEKAGSFWGVGLPEVIVDLQGACNACARALVNNVGMASGPQVVINEEMLADFEKGDFVPWKRWWVNDNDASSPGKKAIEFYQPTLIAQQLISVFDFFMKQADESSGVPAYAHGDPQVGGAGNALANYEKVLTPFGPTEICDLKKGDLVLNTYGSTSKAIGIYPQGESDIFRLYFNNGDHVDCDMNHRWSVRDHHNRKFQTLTTEEILTRGLFRKTKVGYRNPKGWRPKWMLPILDFVEFDKRSVRIDPYTMGALLGDGDSRCRITSEDKEIFDRIPYPPGKADPSQYRGKAYTHAIKGIRPDYRSYGLKCKSTDKFIPEDYLFNSREVRLELLRGMMDTDGCCSKQGEVFFSSSSLRLASDFRNLVRSLGGVANGICEEEGGDFEFRGRKCIRKKNYRVIFNLPGEKIFHLARKQKRIKNKPKTHLYITGIEYLGKFEATCISVDAKDELFVCGNYIPTHNTASGLSMLMTQAARGIKLFIKNIDRKAIEDSIRRQYYWNMERKKFAGLIGDQKIMAKGSISLIAKEQQASRMTELLSISTQTQVLQPQETRKLFKKVLKTHEIDPKEIMEDSPIPLSAMVGYQPNAIPSLAKPTTLNAAGEPAQGTDFQTVYGRGGPASSPVPPAR